MAVVKYYDPSVNCPFCLFVVFSGNDEWVSSYMTKVRAVNPIGIRMKMFDQQIPHQPHTKPLQAMIRALKQSPPRRPNLLTGPPPRHPQNSIGLSSDIEWPSPRLHSFVVHALDEEVHGQRHHGSFERTVRRGWEEPIHLLAHLRGRRRRRMCLWVM